MIQPLRVFTGLFWVGIKLALFLWSWTCVSGLMEWPLGSSLVEDKTKLRFCCDPWFVVRLCDH